MLGIRFRFDMSKTFDLCRVGGLSLLLPLLFFSQCQPYNAPNQGKKPKTSSADAEVKRKADEEKQEAIDYNRGISSAKESVPAQFEDGVGYFSDWAFTAAEGSVSVQTADGVDDISDLTLSAAKWSVSAQTTSEAFDPLSLSLTTKKNIARLINEKADPELYATIYTDEEGEETDQENSMLFSSSEKDELPATQSSTSAGTTGNNEGT